MLGISEGMEEGRIVTLTITGARVGAGTGARVVLVEFDAVGGVMTGAAVAFSTVGKAEDVGKAVTVGKALTVG